MFVLEFVLGFVMGFVVGLMAMFVTRGQRRANKPFGRHSNTAMKMP